MGTVSIRTIYGNDTLHSTTLSYTHHSPLITATVDVFIWETALGVRLRGSVSTKSGYFDNITYSHGYQSEFLRMAALAGGTGGKLSYLKE